MNRPDPHTRTPYPALPEFSAQERVKKAKDTSERLAKRRSCRQFSDAPVDRQIIEYAIQAAGTAPSGANHQPWHFAAIASAETKAAIRLAAEDEERRFYGTDGEG